MFNRFCQALPKPLRHIKILATSVVSPSLLLAHVHDSAPSLGLYPMALRFILHEFLREHNWLIDG